MEETEYLMSRALRSFTEQDIVNSLFKTSFKMMEIKANLEKSSKNEEMFYNSLINPSRHCGWELPDSFWSSILQKESILYCYPLGEITERAVKKTILIIINQISAQKNEKPDLPLHKTQLPHSLHDQLKSLSKLKFLEYFLSQFFFEVCIDRLRRTIKDPLKDLSFWYNFSREGYLLSLAHEQELRNDLQVECEHKAAVFARRFMDWMQDRGSLKCEHEIYKELLGIFDLDKPFVNVVVGSQNVRELQKDFSITQDEKHLLFCTTGANVSFSYSYLEKVIKRPLSPLVRDLVDIGVSVFMSDLYTERKPDLSRKIGLVIPVRYPETWQKAQPYLERAVSILGRDDFRVYFSKLEENKEEELKITGQKEENNYGDCVSLFSGGLDSVSGLVWLLEHEHKPILVSHYANGNLSKIQKSLIEKIIKTQTASVPSDGPILQHYPIYVSKSKSKKSLIQLPKPYRSVMVQHLRTFLYLSLASAIACENGIHKIYMFENGPVALNPLFSEARVNTHTSHPHFLASFQAMIRSVFNSSMTIENPFIGKTKGEIVDILADPKWQFLIKETSSCWNWFKVPMIAKRAGIEDYKDQKHDGTCLPCIIRRAAVNHAGQWENDDHYVENIFSQFQNLDREVITQIADYLRFCKAIQSLPDAELLFRFPDLSIYEEGIDTREAIQMYRRHAAEVLNCFHDRGDADFLKFFGAAL